MKRNAFVLVLIAFSIAGGCSRRGPKAASRSSVVAMVGERPVEWPDAVAYIRQATGEDVKGVSPKVASSLLDQFLEERLVGRAVETALPPISAPSPVEARRELIGRRARLQEIDEALLRKEWAVRRSKDGPALVRVQQLIFRTKSDAEEGKRRLVRGESWGDVSRSFSSAPNAALGGSLGFLAESDLPPKFRSAVWGLRAGEMSPILSTPHGFHIFRVEEKREARAATFEEEAPALRLTLAEERSSAAVEAILVETKKAEPVWVVEEHLPFPYVGAFPRFREKAP